MRDRCKAESDPGRATEGLNNMQRKKREHQLYRGAHESLTVRNIYILTGRVCGNKKTSSPVVSTGYRMLVTYKSSPSGKRAHRGFKANYEGETCFSGNWLELAFEPKQLSVEEKS